MNILNELPIKQSILNNDLAYYITLFRSKKITKYRYYKIKNFIEGKKDLIKYLLKKYKGGEMI